MRLIRDFRELSKEDISLAGGKGASLSELTKAKMPVPPGFVVTTAAYSGFVNENDLGKIVDKSLQDKNNDGAAIRDAFVKSPIPEDIKTKVLNAYKKLGGGPVAVRSSATAEDLPSASFAGQQETYLNIIGEKDLLDATRRTWASLWTERAITYRNRQGIDQKKVKLAVIVQRMVDAEFAGVMFTANPITGNRKEIVIDANPGLGEAVVSGLVTPDHFVMRRQWRGWRAIESTEGKREFIIKSKKGGGTERVEQSDVIAYSHLKLPQKALIELARLGVKIEKYFNSPQDIEWVWAGGEIFIVQSRPITALPDELPKQNKISRVMSGIIAEMMPTRPYPLEATLFGPELLVNDFLKPFLKLIGLRIPRASEFFIEEDGILVRYNGKMQPRPALSMIFAPFRLLALAIRYSPSHWKNDPRVIETIKKIKELEDKNYEKLSAIEVANIAKEALNIFPAIFEVRILYLPRVALSIAALYLALLLVGRRGLFSTLLYSGIITKVTETNSALEGFASKIRGDKILADIFLKNEAGGILRRLENTEIGKNFLREFQSFLDEYGYRESGGTMLVSQPTWKESPEVVFGILKTLTNAPLRSKSKDTWEGARDTLIAQSILRFPPLRLLFLKLLDTARYLQEIREDTRFYIMMAVPTLRRAVLELGNRLTKVKVLNKSQDVFYLKFNELTEAAKNLPLQADQTDKLVSLILRRKSKYADLKSTPIVDPRLYRAQKSKKGALLAGTPGSPGLAEGPARVIRNSSEFDKLRPGDILVAPYTNPAWTPLFEIVSAVVVDTGGVMSHAAIVAREYGIPAVMGTVDGTAKIKDGDQIRVDGTNGRVFASNFFKT